MIVVPTVSDVTRSLQLDPANLVSTPTRGKKEYYNDVTYSRPKIYVCTTIIRYISYTRVKRVLAINIIKFALGRHVIVRWKSTKYIYSIRYTMSIILCRCM